MGSKLLLRPDLKTLSPPNPLHTIFPVIVPHPSPPVYSGNGAEVNLSPFLSLPPHICQTIPLTGSSWMYFQIISPPLYDALLDPSANNSHFGT